jgi:UMF1 family MFS transporter
MRAGVGPLPRRATAAWCLFDFANSSYTTIIITVAFSVYFREVVVNARDNSGDRLWGVSNFIAMASVALISPVIGAVADYSGRKKLFLILTTLVTVGASALLSLAGPGDLALAMLLYIAGTIAFEMGYAFYNAFLPDVSTPATAGRISGWGWAVGYIGGLICTLACQPLISRPLRDGSGALAPEGIRGYQSAFIVVAVFYIVFAMPAFLWLRESPPLGRLKGTAAYVRAGFSRVRETLGHLRRYRDAARFILASMFFNDGITTVISFAGIYAITTMGFSTAEMVTLFLVLNLVAFPGSLVAGYLGDAIGARRTLAGTLVLWMVTVLVGCLATTKAVFWAMAAGAALGVGSTQAVGRAFMSQITPPSRESEFFGFYVLSGKLGSMFGPLTFGVISHYSGSQRLAIVSLLPFFLVGLLLMLSIDERRARTAAAR